MNSVDFSKYDNAWYQPGNVVIRILWYIIHLIFFSNSLFPFKRLKVLLLRLFGAKIGRKVTIKPSVNIKYPWKLEVGNYVWIGENVWIDNLATIRIADNVCISQGAFLLTGNHNYKSISFDLMIGEIELEDGVWIGARAVVCPNVKCESHSILTVGSVANRNLEAYTIYQGCPAIPVKKRTILDN